ncbi:AGAP003399-PA [Anopheles gambiae str. PEST]|uniref:AGAP003399-PA n=2 Tax=gambiae species complex TaxID=44542 RepID=A0NCX7_ANOGA|nr:AGAP003399-PA [Anopheles gambiae str. PEST]
MQVVDQLQAEKKDRSRCHAAQNCFSFKKFFGRVHCVRKSVKKRKKDCKNTHTLRELHHITTTAGQLKQVSQVCSV